MGKVYFILDNTNNNVRFSGKNLTVNNIENNNDLRLIMLKDSNYCGMAQLNQIISGYVVSMECSSYVDYLNKGMKLIDEYKIYNDEVFNLGEYQKILEFNYQINPENRKQYINSNSLTMYLEKIDDKWYYSNPEFYLKNFYC
tara:strand:+ start:349 stop:774 length:426 start_codon:yes stop_codon:yes gene_type:complete